MGFRGGLYWSIVAASVVVLAAASGAEAASPGPPDASRMVMARMYQDGVFVVKHETPAAMGTALAGLKPTYVSALLRFSSGNHVRNRQVRAWNTVVAAVRAASPRAQFSVELNALQYTRGRQIRQRMASVRKRLHPDGWLLDFYTPAARRVPRVTAAALASAHQNGEFLGGNAFGIARHPRIPAGTDFVDVQDSDFRIDLDAVRALTRRAAVFFHVGNSPFNNSSEGCRFIGSFSTGHRIRYLRKRAGQQARYRFHLGYPVFFPECERRRHRSTATVFTYDAVRDPPMMQAIAGLMDTY